MSPSKIEDSSTHTPEPDATVVRSSSEETSKPINAQYTGHVELSGPNPATSRSKASAEAVGTRLGDHASARFRAVRLA